MKVLIQSLWEHNLRWDEPVPDQIERIWKRWHTELQVSRALCVPCPYLPNDVDVKSMEVDRFRNTSEVAYLAVVYLRAIDFEGAVHIALVMAKTKLAPSSSSQSCN